MLQICPQYRLSVKALLRLCEKTAFTCSFEVVPCRTQLEVAILGRNAPVCLLSDSKQDHTVFGDQLRPQVVTLTCRYHTTGYWYGSEHTFVEPNAHRGYLFGVHKPCVPLHAEALHSLALCHEARLHRQVTYIAKLLL